MITCIPGLLTDLPSKHSRVAKVRELCVSKHIRKSYQPTPAAQATLASRVTIKQNSLKREIQTCFQLASAVFQRGKQMHYLTPLLSVE